MYFERLAKYESNDIFFLIKASASVFKSTKTITEAIINTVKVTKGLITVADDLAAPGVKLFSKTFVAAGSTAAKTISGVFAGLGIVTGIMDIVDGASGIKGSKHANALRESAKKIDERTDSYQDFLNEYSHK